MHFTPPAGCSLLHKLLSQQGVTLYIVVCCDRVCDSEPAGSRTRQPTVLTCLPSLLPPPPPPAHPPTHRLFEFVMRMLATGSNCLPAGGIGALAEQLASRLPADTIYTGGVRPLLQPQLIQPEIQQHPSHDLVPQYAHAVHIDVASNICSMCGWNAPTRPVSCCMTQLCAGCLCAASTMHS